MIPWQMIHPQHERDQNHKSSGTERSGELRVLMTIHLYEASIFFHIDLPSTNNLRSVICSEVGKR
jgi:hypothetical protein